MDRLAAYDLARRLLDEHGLPAWSIRFSNAKRVLGSCSHSTTTISLSKEFVALNDEARVTLTIIHEIAHALHGPVQRRGRSWERPHGPRWQAIARSLGHPATTCTSAAVAVTNSAPRRFYAVCPTCGPDRVLAERHVLTAATRRHVCRKHKQPVVWYDRRSDTPVTYTAPTRKTPARRSTVQFTLDLERIRR